MAAAYDDTGIDAEVGVIDSGAWDSLGEQGKRDGFKNVSRTNLARRTGTAGNVSAATLFAMTNTFVTGVTLKVDGGQHLTSSTCPADQPNHVRNYSAGG